MPAEHDDDWSAGEAEFADSGTKGPAKSMRKNRRGQRERRACVVFQHRILTCRIWEKKYGRNANHVKKQQEIAAKDVKPRGRPGFEKGPRNDRPFNKGGKPGPPRAHALV